MTAVKNNAYADSNDRIFDDADALIELAQKSFAKAAKKAVAENDWLGIPTHGSVGDKDAIKAIGRYHRSHDELRWFAPQADLFMAFDNSDCNANPILLASRANGEPLKFIAHGVNPTVDNALDDMV
jgi:hypothetical protein